MFLSRMLVGAAMAAAMLVPATVEAGRIGWPCSGRVSSDYGPRESPCSGCSTYHHGIDIAVPSGTILGSPGNGTVSSYAWNSCGGNIYTIGYGNGWQTRFLHTSGAIRGAGLSITRNQNAAYSGNTGSCTTGAHLHFEVRKDGVSQSVPGAVGTYVTKNADVPRDYAGLNDAPPATVVVVDNSSSGFSVVGTWTTASSAGDKYGSDYRFHSTAPVSEPASWTANLAAGTYGIYAWWPAGSNRSPAAPYILPDNSTVTKNQQGSGGQWNLLGTKSLSGSATTKLSCWATSGYVVMADAIKYQK